METLKFTTQIKAGAAKVWQILWDDETYRKWTTVFHEGSYAVTDWQEGSKVHFLGPNGNGMYSEIQRMKKHELMAIHHLGEVKNGVEQVPDASSEQWGDAMEIYELKEENGYTTLVVSMTAIPNFVAYFNATFPPALAIVKELAEAPYLITVEVDVNASIEIVWKCWTTPEDIMQWNQASDDWHTTNAKVDLRVGGTFSSTMAAKDGSFSFDFGGTYTHVEPNRKLAYTLGDGRVVSINFSESNGITKVIELFEAENVHPITFQRAGWQSIINNFKKHVER